MSDKEEEEGPREVPDHTEDGASNSSPPELQLPDKTTTITTTEIEVQDGWGRTGLYQGEYYYCNNKKMMIPHGYGSIKYYDPDTARTSPHSYYQGPWKDGFFHGPQATYVTPTQEYQGTFFEGQPHEEGRLVVYHNVNARQRRKSYRYTGQFEFNHKHGFGTMEWYDHKNDNDVVTATYQGEFQMNERIGYGEYRTTTTDDTTIHYVGQFQNAYHGQGIYTSTTTTTNNKTDSYQKYYCGQFQNGKPHGYGIQRLEKTKKHTVKEGKWNQGQFIQSVKFLQMVVRDTNASFPLSHGLLSSHHNNNHNKIIMVSSYQGLWDTIQQMPAAGHAVLQFARPNHQNTTNTTNTTPEPSTVLESYQGQILAGGIFHGTGTLVANQSRDVYEGEFWLGYKHGQGTYTWKHNNHNQKEDGVRTFHGTYERNVRTHGRMVYPHHGLYEGEFQNNLRHGNGKFTFQDGSVYNGEWQHGQYHGYGTLVFVNGKVYKGQFQKGQAHGFGQEHDPTGELLYEGEFLCGERKEIFLERKQRQEEKQERIMTTTTTNQGRPPPPREPPPPPPPPATDDHETVVDVQITDCEGKPGKYTGIILKSTQKPNGVGKMVYDDKRRIHEGFWKDGSKEGYGRCQFVLQGDLHEGEYQNNVRHGKGTYVWKDGRRYEGEYKHDLRHGSGIFSYANGDMYQGEFENGLRSGHGRFDFEKGKAYYEGNWKKGMYHGEGVLVWPDGSEYRGDFCEGLLHGEGILKDANGSIKKEGTWINGRFSADIDITTATTTSRNSSTGSKEAAPETTTVQEEAGTTTTAAVPVTPPTATRPTTRVVHLD